MGEQARTWLNNSLVGRTGNPYYQYFTITVFQSVVFVSKASYFTLEIYRTVMHV